MSDPFLGIGGVNYATEEAKALQVNERGELATENVLKRELILQEESVSPAAPFTHTIAAADIPKGAGYIGIYIASLSVREFSLTYEVSRRNDFGVIARFMQQTYDFRKGRTNHVVREVGNLDGSSIRIRLDTQTPTTYSIWIIYYRNATPTTSELKPGPRQEVVGAWDVTVAPGQTGTPPQAPTMSEYRYYYYAINAGTTHDWALDNGINVAPATAILASFPILASARRGNTVTDMYDVVASRMQPRITNNSSIEQTYTITLIGVK